jgi:septum formation protein
MSTVKIKSMNNAELDNYIKTARWQGKAGAYGIQETPEIVESYKGNYYNIVGLPINRTVETINEMINA